MCGPSPCWVVGRWRLSARHAHADSVDVAILATPGELTVDLTDDGVGIGEATRRSDLANLATAPSVTVDR